MSNFEGEVPKPGVSAFGDLEFSIAVILLFIVSSCVVNNCEIWLRRSTWFACLSSILWSLSGNARSNAVSLPDSVSRRVPMDAIVVMTCCSWRLTSSIMRSVLNVRPPHSDGMVEGSRSLDLCLARDPDRSSLGWRMNPLLSLVGVVCRVAGGVLGGVSPNKPP